MSGQEIPLGIYGEKSELDSARGGYVWTPVKVWLSSNDGDRMEAKDAVAFAGTGVP